MAVVLMGLGTVALIGTVAVLSTATRRSYFKGTSVVFDGVYPALPALQVFAGALIVIISLSLLQFVI